jgi:hypothetical protein
MDDRLRQLVGEHLRARGVDPGALDDEVRARIGALWVVSGGRDAERARTIADAIADEILASPLAAAPRAGAG